MSDTTHPTIDALSEMHHAPESDAARKLSAHVDACPICRERLARMARVGEHLSREVEPPSRLETFSAKARFLTAALQDAERPAWQRLFDGVWRPLPVTLGLALVLLVAGALIWSASLPETNEPPAPEMAKTDPQNLENGPQIAPATPPAADADRVVGNVMAVEGRSSVITPQGETQALSLKTRVLPGSTVEVAEDASAFLSFGLEHQVLLNGARAVVVQADRAKGFEFTLTSGSLAARVTKLDAGKHFVVNSPSVSVSVVGTHFAVATDESMGTLVAVREGVVRVTPHNNPSMAITLEAGELLRIDTNLLATRARMDESSQALKLFSPQIPGKAPLTEPEVLRSERKPTQTPKPARTTPPEPKPAQTTENATSLLADARAARAELSFSKTLGLSDALIARYPGSPAVKDARYLKAESLLGLGKVEEALTEFRRVAAFEDRPDLAENALYVSGYLLQERLNRLDDARAVWLDYLSRYPSGTLRQDAAFALCRNESQSKRFKDAMLTCTRFADRYRTGYQTARALLRAADSAYALESFSRAADLYARYLSHPQADQDALALYRQGDCLLRSGRNTEALDTFQTFMKRHATHPLAAKVEAILSSMREQ